MCKCDFKAKVDCCFTVGKRSHSFATDYFVTCKFWKWTSMGISDLKEPALNKLCLWEWLRVLPGRCDKDSSWGTEDSTGALSFNSEFCVSGRSWPHLPPKVSRHSSELPVIPDWLWRWLADESKGENELNEPKGLKSHCGVKFHGDITGGGLMCLQKVT